jgi:toxin CptA
LAIAQAGRIGCNAAMETPRLPILELRPSPRLAALLGTAHLATLLLLGLLPVPPGVLGLAAAAVAASAVWSIRRHALRVGAGAICALDFEDRERVRYRLGHGRWYGGRIAASSTVSPLLCVLNIEHQDRATRHVVLAGDALDAGDLRRLRVWLRLGPATQGEDTR